MHAPPPAPAKFRFPIRRKDETNSGGQKPDPLVLVDALLYSFTIIVTLCVVISNRSLVFVMRADSEVTILRTFSHASTNHP
jgi:hypothetical protein